MTECDANPSTTFKSTVSWKPIQNRPIKHVFDYLPFLLSCVLDNTMAYEFALEISI